MRQRGWQLAVKRFVDRAGALVCLTLCAPVLAATALWVRASLGRPVLFRQERPGRFGRLFRIYKFRTMLDLRDENGRPLPDELRITPTGRLIRSLSLDELPQLVNVLRGELSFVGPRPLLTQYLGRYTAEQARRHDAYPGITGWAQVNGRNAVSWDERFAMDVWYVDNWSLWLDAKILGMTVWRVLRRDGVSQRDHATMPEFMGSEGPRP